MEKIKWYFKLPTVVIAVLVLGPFAIPLVWKNPGLSKRMRILISVLIIALTIWIISASINVMQLILKEVADLQKTF
ncbi:MAG: hypothetical protein WC779_05125 [Candidatus Omnitrophota bacterium]|jgi:hypothetical protein